MLDTPAPKTMAKALRAALTEREVYISHAQCLDLVARQLGYANWNVLSARSEFKIPDPEMPEGWHHCGHFRPGDFRIGIVEGVEGIAASEAVAGRDIARESFAGLMQSIAANGYKGQRIRLTAQLKSRNARLGTIWMRVDPEGGGRSRALAFDNMVRRKTDGVISGDTDWVEREIVLDVPDEAASIHFGFFLQAPGSVWARKFSLESVSKDVPITALKDLPQGPVNLGFD